MGAADETGANMNLILCLREHHEEFYVRLVTSQSPAGSSDAFSFGVLPTMSIEGIHRGMLYL